jgi:hypothetical protein
MEHKDYSGAIRWLSDRKVEDGLIADLFGKATSSIQVIAWRDANRLIPQKVAQVLSDIQAAGMSADEIIADAKIEKAEIQAPTQISQLEEQSRCIWPGVLDKGKRSPRSKGVGTASPQSEQAFMGKHSASARSSPSLPSACRTLLACWLLSIIPDFWSESLTR